MKTPRSAQGGTIVDPAAPGEKTTAATLVYRNLKSDLLRGAYGSGEKLMIEQIALRYGAGTNPVREALNRLAAERMVDREDQRGFSVPMLSIVHFRDIVRARCWLEGLALAESVRHRSEAWEDDIVLSLHRLMRTPFLFGADARDAEDNREWEIRHRQFHRALISNCGSPWLLRFCEELMDQAERYRYISDTNTYPRRDSDQEHRLIADAALNGDAEAAVGHLVAQYELTFDLYEAKVRAESDTGNTTEGD